MKAKSELKAALEALQVKKPLKLSCHAPSFTPPVAPVLAPTPVAPETQVVPASQVAVPTEVSEKPAAENAMNSSPLVSTSTLVPAATQVSPVTQVPKETQASPTTRVSRATEGTLSPSAGNQDSSVMLESQAAPKLHQGYTRLPNSILMRIVSGELVRSEIQILLLVARFTISFQRRHAPLSKAVLERQTGLRGPAVLQAVSDLIAKGLIEKIPGDQYRPNCLGLVFQDDWDFFDKPGKPKDAQVPETKGTLVPAQTQVAPVTQVSTTTPAPVAVPTPAGVPAATHFKDNKTIENKISLSSLTPKLQAYFSGLKPERKRESEWNAFGEIRKDFSSTEVELCFDHVQKNGLPGGQACHSPMAYLARAISDVLAIVTAEREETQRRATIATALELSRKQAEQAEALEQQEFAARELAFDRAFSSPDEQCQIIAELCSHHGFFTTTGQAARAYAISAWWHSLSESEQQEATA